jgi:uncharacterized protein
MDKLEELEEFLKPLDKFVLAFSGGLDSSFLACFMKNMGKQFIAVTVDNGMLRNLEEIKESAKALGLKHEVVKIDLLDDKVFTENSPERCYICKKEILRALEDIRRREDYNYVIDATTKSAIKDYQAALVALKEEGVLAPLFDIGLEKKEIREIAKRFNLKSEGQESCLATRFPTYTDITKRAVEKLRIIENEIRKLGFPRVRARAHGALLRIEVPDEDMRRILERRNEISKIVKSQGFGYATLDMAGYSRG